VDDPGNDPGREVNIQFGPDTVLHTDADGRWSCNMIPEEFDQISFTVSHGEYAETTATVQRGPSATNVTVTMKPGFKVTGVVQDINGNPVAGAKVREVRLNSEGEHSQKTDASGAFEFKSMKAGELMLAVQVKGFAPAVQTMDVVSNIGALRFQLGPGQLLRGSVVDEDGKPITNAWAETLRTAIDKVVWSTWVDGDGRFTWESAPQEAIPYSFEAEGYGVVYGTNLLADGTEHVIKLTRKQPDKDDIQITGTAVDAGTGKPVDGFRVLLGEVFQDWAPPLELGTTGKDGKFSLTSHRGALRTNYVVQIEKDGYLPAVSSILPLKDDKQKLDFKLQKGSGPTGVVLLPSGEPAAKAKVFLCTPQAGVTIEGSAQVQTGINTSTYIVRTDEAGNFSLPPAPSPQGVIAVHEEGFAFVSMADLTATGRVGLQPWGRIEGSLTLDSQPAANETIVAFKQDCGYDSMGRRFGLVTFRGETKTDAAGKFSFEKVPPGECSIFRQQRSARDRFTSHGTSVMVKAGEASQATLGGAGRPVVGKAALPGASGPVDWQGVRVSISQKLSDDPGPFPRRHEFASNEEFIDAVKRWEDANRARQTFGAFCESDGSFRLQDIPPGTYQIKIVLNAKPGLSTKEGFTGDLPEIASLERDVTVSEDNGGPVDVGTLELTPKAQR
jgi:protocatechuate 3,4-dioxygenase beta subunit